MAQQNISIVKRYTRPFVKEQRLLFQFPFALAAKMPKNLLIGDGGRRIEHVDYKRAHFQGLPDYDEFETWLMQQMSHFFSDNRTKCNLMLGQDGNEQRKFAKKALSPEPKEGESYSLFSMQYSRITHRDHMRLYSALSLVQLYAHDKDCRMYCLNLNREATEIVSKSERKGILQAKVLCLERDLTQIIIEASGADVIEELRDVQGIDFCCGESTYKTAFSEEHLAKIGPNSREVFLNRTSLPDYNYATYKARIEVIVANAEERHLNGLRREKQRHTSDFWTWLAFYAFEGVDVQKFT